MLLVVIPLLLAAALPALLLLDRYERRVLRTRPSKEAGQSAASGDDLPPSGS